MLRRATALKRICDRQRVQNAVSLLDSHISWKISTIYEKFGK